MKRIWTAALAAVLAAGALTACGGEKKAEEEILRRETEETEFNAKKELLDQLQGKEKVDAMAGADEKTVKIGSAEDLMEFCDRVNGGELALNAVLTADIDLSSVCGEGTGSFSQIASREAPGPYNGIFDGDGHVISGLYMNSEDMGREPALFPYIGVTGVVRNLGIGVPQIESKMEAAVQSDECEGVVENCYADGSVKGSSAAGLIYGASDGAIIKNCYFKGTVEGTSRAGGVICHAYDAQVSQCYNEAAVTVIMDKTASSTNSGGVIASANSSKVTDCWNTGAVSGPNEVGGVVAGLHEKSVLENCWNTGSVTGGWRVAGVAASVDSSAVNRCQNSGAVYGESLSAGIAVASGKRHTRRVVGNCLNRGEISGMEYVAVVHTGGNCVVINCFNGGSVLSENGGTAGAAGVSQTGVRSGESELVIANCYSSGTMSEEAGGISYGNKDVVFDGSCYLEDTAAGYFFNRKGDEQDPTYSVSAEQLKGEVLDQLNAYVKGFTEFPDGCSVSEGIVLDGWKAGADGYPTLEWEN